MRIRIIDDNRNGRGEISLARLVVLCSNFPEIIGGVTIGDQVQIMFDKVAKLPQHQQGLVWACL